jgi:RNA polymerase sigma-70 factor (ECF subfamily)
MFWYVRDCNGLTLRTEPGLRDSLGAVNREAGAFAQLYDDQVWNVYGFFGYRVRSREEAEDLTQLTFERALRAWERFDPDRASPRTWLLAIAHNLLVDHYRADRSSRREPLPDDEAGVARLGQGADPSEASLGISPELDAALSGLGERERELIALRFGGDLTSPEIAAVTGLSVANVQQILSRSLRKLRAQLEAEAASESTPP